MSKTIPEQLEELYSKTAGLEKNVASLTADLDTEKKARSEEKNAFTKSLGEAEAKVVALTGQLTTSNASLETANKQLGELTSKYDALGKQIKSADERAVEIMAKVGQPKPVSTEPAGTGEAKSLTERCQEAKSAK